MPKALVNGISLYYEVHGNGEPLVLVGGFSTDYTAWNEVLALFTANYQVIVFDNRGAGQSEVPATDYSIADFSKDIIELCDYLGIQKAHFIGNSMGGMIVQHLAYQYPARVQSAVISNSCSIASVAFNVYLQAQLGLLNSNASIEPLIQATCAWIYSYDFLVTRGKLSERVRLALENPHPFTIEGYQGQFAALKNFNSSEFLSSIHVPTLVISSDKDIVFLEKTTKELALNIPNAEYFLFTECGHLPYVEYPELFVNIVQTFIQRLG